MPLLESNLSRSIMVGERLLPTNPYYKSFHLSSLASQISLGSSLCLPALFQSFSRFLFVHPSHKCSRRLLTPCISLGNCTHSLGINYQPFPDVSEIYISTFNLSHELLVHLISHYHIILHKYFKFNMPTTELTIFPSKSGNINIFMYPVTEIRNWGDILDSLFFFTSQLLINHKFREGINLQ